MTHNRSLSLTRGAVIVAFTLAGATHSAVADAMKQDKTVSARIHVTVGKFRNQSGALGCLLFEGKAGFPDDISKSIRQAMSSIASSGTASCDFVNLTPGDYAVIVMHDENKNGAFDKNFVGMPTEGYGASNNHLPAMASPTWEDSRFSVGPDETKAVNIQLRYF